MKFVTAINCMDGRVQLPVIEWMKQTYNAKYVDMVTAPGPNKILSDDKYGLEASFLQKRVEISVKKHLSKIIAVVGHYDCAGNPTDLETQKKQIKNAVETITSWRFGVIVIGLWVDEHWSVHKLV